MTIQTNNKIILTETDFNEKLIYIGKEDLTETTRPIEIKENLGIVTFPKNIKTTESITAGSGTGIKSRFGFVAGKDIISPKGIGTDMLIYAGNNILSEEGNVCAGTTIEAGNEIKCGFRKHIIANTGPGFKEKDNFDWDIKAKKITGDVILGKVELIE